MYTERGTGEKKCKRPQRHTHKMYMKEFDLIERNMWNDYKNVLADGRSRAMRMVSMDLWQILSVFPFS